MERLHNKNKGMVAIGVEQPRKVDIIQTVQDYGNRLFSFIRNRVKSDEDAQDILQDAYRTDVRPLIAEAREREGGALNPIGVFREQAVRKQLIGQRGKKTVATGL